MELLIAYVVAPLVLTGLCIGAGLLVAFLAPKGTFGALLAPVGLTILVLIGAMTTFFAPTASWTTGIVCAVAVAGLAIAAVERMRNREGAGGQGPVDWWPLLVGVAAFALFAAPVALSGAASWAGWVKLDDTASWLGFTDWLMANGKTLPAEVTSTYERLIDVNFRGTGAAPYPTGAFPPLGVLSQLTGRDPAWLLHPYMSVLGALLAVALYRILKEHIRTPWARTAAAVVAAQAATLVAYVLWGGMKEILLPVILAVLAVTSAEAARSTAPRRLVALPLLASVAFLSVTGASGVGYVAPILLGAGLIGWTARRPRSGAIAATAAGAALITGVLLLAVGAVPSRLSLAPEILDIGNLIRPLNPWQSVGVWIGADFRVDPDVLPATVALVALAAALAVVGLIAAARDRSWSLPLFTGTAVLVVVYSQFAGGAWLAGKAMAVASPGVIAAAMVGAAWIARRSTAGRVVAIAAATAVAAGVVWSNALAYRAVWLAPVALAAELEEIGRDYAGRGPALMTDYSTFGGRHFLRDLDTEVASELRVSQIPLRDGALGQKGESFDVVAFPPSTLEAYPLLVLRRSPTAARPPANYQLVRSGRYYDVWQRVDGSPAITSDVPLAGPYAIPPEQACAAIEALGAGASGRELVAGVSRPAFTSALDTKELPDGWIPAGLPGAVVPDGSGQVTATVDVPAAGAYEVWMGGSFLGAVEVTIDGVTVGARGALEGDPAASTSLGVIALETGAHDIVVTYDAPWWRPGMSAGPFPMGPVALTPVDSDDRLVTVPADKATTLCDRELDWVALPGESS